MPEIPDIEVFSRNLKKLLAGKQVTKVKVVNGKKLKDTAKELPGALEGKKSWMFSVRARNYVFNFQKKFYLAFTSC